MIFAALLQPKSTGKLWLRSASPYAAPCIDLGFFTHPDDQPRLAQALRLIRQMAAARPLASLEPIDLTDPTVPLDQTCSNAWSHSIHPVSTCKMGKADDPSAVVDPQGRVYGLENLRVVDASILPSSIRTNQPEHTHGRGALRRLDGRIYRIRPESTAKSREPNNLQFHHCLIE